jgi:hypothetical protein
MMMLFSKKNGWSSASRSNLDVLNNLEGTMPKKLISDASISDSEKKRVTIRILVTRVNDMRH